jgi:hypothetical protein
MKTFRHAMAVVAAAGALLFPVAAHAQVGTTGVIFLTIEPGARQAGMGGGGVALGRLGDATASFYNPAGLALMTGKSVTGMHNKALPELVDDFYYEFLGGTYSLGDAGGLGANITFYSFGNQEVTDGVGNVTGSIDSFDLAATMAYGLTLSSRTAVGGSFKVIYSSLSPYGAEAEQGTGRTFGFALDAGLLIQDILPRVNLGLVLQNVGPDIVYIDRDQADPLPQNLRVGLAWRALETEGQRLTVIYDAYKLLARDSGFFAFHLIGGWTDDPVEEELRQIVHMAGAEYLYADLLALRGGYFYDRVGHVRYPTFGIGVAYGLYRFDLSHVYAPDKPYAQGTRVSFGLVF